MSFANSFPGALTFSDFKDIRITHRHIPNPESFGLNQNEAGAWLEVAVPVKIDMVPRTLLMELDRTRYVLPAVLMERPSSRPNWRSPERNYHSRIGGIPQADAPAPAKTQRLRVPRRT